MKNITFIACLLLSVACTGFSQQKDNKTSINSQTKVLVYFFLPIIFALATGLPVIIIAWILAYSVAEIVGFYKNIKAFEIWFRRIVAVIFIVAGFYYLYIFYFR